MFCTKGGGYNPGSDLLSLLVETVMDPLSRWHLQFVLILYVKSIVSRGGDVTLAANC